MQNQAPESSFSFANLFKGCGCMGRDDKDPSHAHNKAIGGTPMERNVDGRSSVSGLDWSDVEELPAFDPNQPGYQSPFKNNAQEQGFPYDNYETLEPIDFEYLKEVIKDSDANADGENSVGGLSRSSKKIVKSEKASPTAKHQVEKPKKATATQQKRGKRNPWQPHEDARLLELIAKHGQSWTLLSSMMEGRSAKQIRDRYMHILRPNIKKGDWTPQEDQHILALYYQFGHKWSTIATMVQGRTEGQVKNRFYSHIKKKLLKDEEDPHMEGYNHVKPIEEQKTESPTHDSDLSTTIGRARYSAAPTDNQTYGRINSGGSKITFEDPTNLITYENNEETYGYNRHGSKDKFLALQTINNETLLRLGSNESDLARRLDTTADTEVRRLGSNESKMMFEFPPSPFSSLTTNSNFSKVRNEKDVDLILDRMTTFFNKNSPDQEGYVDEDFDKKEKADQLNKRKAALEYLLMKTMEEMNTYGLNTGVPAENFHY